MIKYLFFFQNIENNKKNTYLAESKSILKFDRINPNSINLKIE